MINIRRLSNGIRMVTEKIDHVQSVSIGIWVRAGARDEEPVVSGVSHFIEHMMFKGTEKRSAKQIAEDADKIAGQMNAFTGKEATCYYMKTLSSNAEKAAEILIDMFTNSKFDKYEMGKEKKVIMEEMKMTNDTPDDVAHDTISELVFKGNPLSKSILGTKTSLKGISRDMLLDYIRKEYTKDSIVVSVSGNFDEERLIDMFNEGLADLPEKKELKVYEEVPYTPLFKSVVRDIEQAHICLGARGVSTDDDMYHPFTILNNIMGGSMSSRLFQNIREEKGLAYSVYSMASTYSDMGYFNIYAGVASNRIEAAIGGISDELKRLRKDFVSQEELDMAKEQLKGSYIFSQENVNSRMFAAGKNVVLFDKVYPLEDTIREIDSVTLDDLRAAAELIWDIDKYSAVVVSGEKVNIKKIMGCQ
ncbi:MAG: insulinase family protein [Firmicutes bacterium]|nr:insulinase family protein [Bacillota bacterium]